MASTLDRLVRGLFRLYTFGYPSRSIPLAIVRDNIQETAKKTRVVEEAAKLAEKIICGFFSEYLEPAVVKPGDVFDGRLMVCSDSSQKSRVDTAACNVLLTTDLGIFDLTTYGNPRVLLKPKVLLAVSNSSWKRLA